MTKHAVTHRWNQNSVGTLRLRTVEGHFTSQEPVGNLNLLQIRRFCSVGPSDRSECVAASEQIRSALKHRFSSQDVKKQLSGLT